MANDNTLIYRAQSGDEQAFVDLIRVYYPFVYAIVIRIVSNPHDAEEVVQDTFLNAHRGLAQYQETAKFKNWLAEIARNRARSWLRKQRVDTVPIDEVSEHTLGMQDLPDEQLIRREQRELIRRAMETLSEKDRDIARAYYLDGASYDELTSTHGLSYNAIAFRLSRAKRQLSKRLQYLLTGIFVSPAMTLKKMYSGGLTVMKVGTVSKITVGLAALVALIFIGFVGVRQMNAPTVEERVYLSPWEGGTARLRNNAAGLAAQTDSAQDIESENTQPQIATAESAAGMESIDESFSRYEETDTTQFATEVEPEPETDQSFTTDTSTLLDDKGQSPEDVMNAYLEAFKNLDFEAMGLLMIGAAREAFEDFVNSGLVTGLEDMLKEVPAEMHQMIEQQMQSMMLNSLSQLEVVSSEYVGDEFHFRLGVPAPDPSEVPEIPGMEISDVRAHDELVRMRKVDGVWRIYDSETLD